MTKYEYEIPNMNIAYSLRVIKALHARNITLACTNSKMKHETEFTRKVYSGVANRYK